MNKSSKSKLGTTMLLKLQATSSLKLTVIQGNSKGQEFIVDGVAVAGYDPASDINIEDPLVCPRHARFFKEENWWIVKDMLSESGTFLNDKLIKQAPIFPDSRLRMGNTILGIDYVAEPELDQILINKQGEWMELPAIIAHELKNYLQFFDAGIEQLKNDTEIGNRFSGEIKSFEIAGEYMQELVQMLRVGCAKPKLVKADFVELIWEQISIIESAANAAGVILEISLPDRSIPVYVDEYQIGRCILNLLKNSLEACKKGNIIGVMLKQESEHHLILVIRDTGEGMDKETLESMWTPMFTTKKSGNGLGSFISKTIIVQHKGQIHAESTPGKGTVIQIELPRGNY